MECFCLWLFMTYSTINPLPNLSINCKVLTAKVCHSSQQIYDEYWSLLITSPLVMQNVIVQVSGHGFGHLPQDVLFPPRNMVSPVVDLLHEALQEYPWGRKGLGIVSVSTQIAVVFCFVCLCLSFVFFFPSACLFLLKLGFPRLL